MAKVICPKCGSEVRLPEKSDLVIGKMLSKECEGTYKLDLEKEGNGMTYYRNENLAADTLFRGTTKTQEEKAMRNQNQINATVKENTMNEINLAKLADMVAERIAAGTVGATVKEEPTGEVNKGQWAKNSKFYGKVIAGNMYNPYMIRRHLPAQYRELFLRYNTNTHKAVREMPYMYAITTLVEEIRKLAMLEKRDRIAFEERKLFFPIQDCCAILNDYFNKLNEFATNDLLSLYGKEFHKVGYVVKENIKGYGYITVGTIEEKIENHKVVKYIRPDEELERFIGAINQWRNEVIPYTWDGIHFGYTTYEKLSRKMQGRDLIVITKQKKNHPVWIEDFRKAGAYYTLKNEIALEGAEFRGMTGRAAVNELRKELVSGGRDGKGAKAYQFHAMLKEVRPEWVVEAQNYARNYYRGYRF